MLSGIALKNYLFSYLKFEYFLRKIETTKCTSQKTKILDKFSQGIQLF